MSFLERLFPPLPFDGDCSFRLRDRNEGLEYSDERHRLWAELTWSRGVRLYTDSLEWETPRPDASEQARVVTNLLVYLKGRRRRAAKVVLNSDDPRRPIYESVCEAHPHLVAAIEDSTDQGLLDYQKQSLLEGLERGDSVQFGAEGSPTTSPEVVEEHYTRLAEERRLQRQREREEIERTGC